MYAILIEPFLTKQLFYVYYQGSGNSYYNLHTWSKKSKAIPLTGCGGL
jgi:hypothetical protein